MFTIVLQSFRKVRGRTRGAESDNTSTTKSECPENKKNARPHKENERSILNFHSA